MRDVEVDLRGVPSELPVELLAKFRDCQRFYLPMTV